MFDTERATKKAYLTDLNGGNVIDFQFTPEELEFFEGGRFADRQSVGEYHTDYIWISGKPNKFNLKMWVDRTQEAFATGVVNVDPFADSSRFPGVANRKYTNFDLVNLVRGIRNGSTSSGFQSTFFKPKATEGNSVDPSIYSFNPDFPQDVIQNNIKGVYYDLERLLYYVRPQGFKLSSGTISTDGVVSLTNFSQTRFMPPPMVRFFYGNSWSEGYIEEVKYSLTAMNKQLVPRRLEADISFLRTRWGYLEELASTTANPAIINFDEINQ